MVSIESANGGFAAFPRLFASGCLRFVRMGGRRNDVRRRGAPFRYNRGDGSESLVYSGPAGIRFVVSQRRWIECRIAPGP